jgi:hypothetical protein
MDPEHLQGANNGLLRAFTERQRVVDIAGTTIEDFVSVRTTFIVLYQMTK